MNIVRRLAAGGVAGSAFALALFLPWPSALLAHGGKAGDITIEHPYATPTVPGAANGAAYFRALVNSGKQSDRLLSAVTPVAASVEIHRSSVDGQNVMRMRALDALEIPAGTTLQPRHGGDTHLMLIGLKAPLKVGDRFPLTLRFERGGEREVTVWVQQPRNAGGEHKH